MRIESQTDVVHLYYLKDYKKKPAIIINPQGYVVTRSVAYDEMVNENFFSFIIELIQHFHCKKHYK